MYLTRRIVRTFLLAAISALPVGLVSYVMIGGALGWMIALGVLVGAFAALFQAENPQVLAPDDDVED